MRHITALFALLVSIWIAGAAPLSAGTELVMIEEAGCMWCARWNREIAPIYPKTAEGRAAPLRRASLRGDNSDMTLKTGIHFTPTFILTVDGVEHGRIEGYPGEAFFWGLLGRLIEEAPGKASPG